MSFKDLDFDVLLDVREGEKILGAAILKKGSTGVADSFEAVLSAGLVPCPTYWVGNGKAKAPKDSDVHTRWHDTFGERLVVEAKKDYEGIKRGVHVVDIQGGGVIIPRPDVLRQRISDGMLINRAVQITEDDKEMLLGERQAFVYRGGEIQQLRLDHFFTDYRAFCEEFNGEGFLADMPSFAVVRSQSDAKQNPSGWTAISEQYSNPDLVIPFGGQKRAKAVLDKVRSFGRTNYGSHHDGYGNVDSGRVVVASRYNGGVSCGSGIVDIGRSVGVRDGVAMMVSAGGADARGKSDGIERPDVDYRTNGAKPMPTTDELASNVLLYLAGTVLGTDDRVLTVAREQVERGIEEVFDKYR